MKIFVGSKNPVKLNAVINAISETWPDAEVKGYETESGISEQPRSDEETYEGALNRAKQSLAFGKELVGINGNEEILGIGLEGGVFEKDNGEMWSTVWVVVVDKLGREYSSNGARFIVPNNIADLIRTGQEMGPVVAQLVGEADVRSKQGMIGVITRGFVNRTEEYMGICKMAIGLYFGRDWDKELS